MDSAAAQTQTMHVGDLNLNVLTWGKPEHPPLVLLHGWMDCAASWQFVVQALQQSWYVIAPDLRGFGQSDHQAGSYFFPSYLADLDYLLKQLSPDRPINLVGHSLGGNISCLYAGIRPTRINKLISVEGFGLPPSTAEDAAERYAEWLDQLQRPSSLKHYASFDALADRLQRSNILLSRQRAEIIARAWGKQTDNGIELRGDPKHKLKNPTVYRLQEAQACWQRVTADTLWIAGKQSIWAGMVTSPGFSERSDCFQSFRFEWIEKASHMIHHDQPQALAALIEAHCK